MGSDGEDQESAKVDRNIRLPDIFEYVAKGKQDDVLESDTSGPHLAVGRRCMFRARFL